MSQEPRTFHAGEATVEVHPNTGSLGLAAAVKAAGIIDNAITAKGSARIIASTGNWQLPLISMLVKQDLDWKRVEVFHMDEYVGLAADHPASFRQWIRDRIEAVVHPGETHYLQPASLVQRHPNTFVYLDADSAALLNP